MRPTICSQYPWTGGSPIRFEFLNEMHRQFVCIASQSGKKSESVIREVMIFGQVNDGSVGRAGDAFAVEPEHDGECRD